MRYFSIDARLILHSKLNLKCCNLNYVKTIYIPIRFEWCVDVDVDGYVAVVVVELNVLAKWMMLCNGYALTIALITHFMGLGVVLRVCPVLCDSLVWLVRVSQFI